MGPRGCEDINECISRPCLHGGSCLNGRPGFMCVCSPKYTGEHCEWPISQSDGSLLLPPYVIAGLTFSILLISKYFLLNYLINFGL